MNLFKRFLKVFELAYKRYLDIEKAMAQAREAQIQLALERIRARTMAMQKSEELQDAAILLFQQIRSLGVQTGSCGFNIWNKKEKTVTVWMSSAEGGLQAPFDMPLTESPIYRTVDAAMKKGDEFLVEEVEGKNLVKHFDYLLTLPGIGDTIKHLRKTGYVFPERMVYHFAFFKNGFLSFHTHESYTEAHDIFKRFANVFEQTYTRFLDLQKAEAQARESQVQLALERVRARTMAMQRSDELPGAATILFQQVQSLGMPAFAAGYCIWDEDKQAITLWMSSEGILQPPFKAPTTEDELFIEMRKGHEEGKSFHVVEMGGKKLVAHYQYMRTLPVVGEIFDSIIEAGHPLPTFQIMHHAYFSKGFLLFITYEPVPDAHDIFKRFAKVFEQTYTRFLDLQKAEAQAREARIETALERIRARALAMHKFGRIDGRRQSAAGTNGAVRPAGVGNLRGTSLRRRSGKHTFMACLSARH